MTRLRELFEYEFLYGQRLATVFKLEQGAKIIGFIFGNKFELRVLTIGNNPPRKGLGQKALEFLRPKFTHIYVSEIREGALPFWIKMKERGLVDKLVSIKLGGTLYLIENITSNRKHLSDGPAFQPPDENDYFAAI